MSEEEFLIRILVCFGLSFFVGLERQYRGRSVGLRTTILVSLGAFLFVSFSFYVSPLDMTRIAAGVVTGIGFLGAGVIIKDGINIRGLTTASTLWCDAGISILCTAGLLFEAVVGTLLILFSNTILRFINKKIRMHTTGKNSYYRYYLNLVTNNKNVLSNMDNFMINNDVFVENMKVSKLPDGNRCVYIAFSISCLKSNIINDVIKELSSNKEVLSFDIKKDDESYIHCIEEL